MVEECRVKENKIEQWWINVESSRVKYNHGRVM